MESPGAQDGGRTEPASPAGPLLERVADFYHKALLRGSRGLKCLARLGLDDSHLIESFRLGHCAGTLLDLLPAGDPKRLELARLGLAAETDGRMRETLADHLVVPVTDAQGGVTDLTPLRGMRLRAIEFDLDRIRCGLEVLGDMPTLTEVNGHDAREFLDFWIPIWRKGGPASGRSDSVGETRPGSSVDNRMEGNGR